MNCPHCGHEMGSAGCVNNACPSSWHFYPTPISSTWTINPAFCAACGKPFAVDDLAVFTAAGFVCAECDMGRIRVALKAEGGIIDRKVAEKACRALVEREEAVIPIPPGKSGIMTTTGKLTFVGIKDVDLEKLRREWIMPGAGKVRIVPEEEP